MSSEPSAELLPRRMATWANTMREEGMDDGQISRAIAVAIFPTKLIAPWENDAGQFARLIAELEAAGAFQASLDDETVETVVAKSMDLELADLRELIDRAQNAWEVFKQATIGGPFDTNHYIRTGKLRELGDEPDDPYGDAEARDHAARESMPEISDDDVKALYDDVKDREEEG